LDHGVEFCHANGEMTERNRLDAGVAERAVHEAIAVILFL
jgi:hypothetical protein